MKSIKTEPLTEQGFAAFGQVIQKEGAKSFAINDGTCERYHDLASVEVIGTQARAIINIFSAQPFKLPLKVSMVERHPYGSQAFFPLSSQPFVVFVCEDEDGTPVNPRAFLTQAGQGINLGRNIWHGVLTTLNEPADFIVVDRAGEEDNLALHHFDTPFIVS